MSATEQLKDWTVRASTVLTNSYVAGTIVFDSTDRGALYNQLIIYMNVTAGNITSFQYKIEGSPDGVTYYQELLATPSATTTLGTSTEVPEEHSILAGALTNPVFYASPIKHRYVRVSVKATGDVTNSLCAITASTGVV